MKKILFAVLVIPLLFTAFDAKADYSFTMSLSVSGCTDLDGRVAEQVNKALMEHYQNQSLGIPDRATCEQLRNLVMSEGSYHKGSCTVRIICSPCTGSGGAIGSVDVLGVSKGNSFYSTNGANEIRDWSNDDMERMLALNSNIDQKEQMTVVTGDYAFDDLIANMPYSDEAFSGRMPKGSTFLKADDNITTIGQPNKGNGVLVPDDFTSKPFDYGLGVWSSDDLNPLKVDLKPVPNGIKTFDDEGWDLWRDGLRLGKDMGMFIYGLGEGVAGSTVAVASILGDANINLWTELYKAKSKIDLGETYEAPENILTESAVFWGGKEYAIVGNVLYNAWNSTVGDFVNLIGVTIKDKVKEKALDDVRDRVLTEEVSKKMPNSGNIIELGNIAVDSFNFGGKVTDYINKRK